MHDSFPELWLKPGEDKRLRAGHLWIFSNEIDTNRRSLKELEPGQSVIVRDAGNRPLGSAYVNPHSLICARLVSRDARHTLTRSLLIHRLQVALSLRERFFDRPYYRLIHGEGDFVPGLIVDRFDDTCVVQANTAGIEHAKTELLAALDKVLAPRRILWRADSAMRELEGLPRYVEWAHGPATDELRVEENQSVFVAPAQEGQKTGWYYDHRANRAALAPLLRDARVLDVFSYVGAWGVQALAAGAADVTCVDSSERALDFADRNAKERQAADRLRTIEGDAFAALEALRADGERFDAVIVDPPAFIKRRKDFKAGLRGYRRINELAMRLLRKDGLLFTASCSAHLAEADLVRTVQAAARHLDRSAQILAFGQQGQDHPVHPAIPETRYLKGMLVRLLPA